MSKIKKQQQVSEYEKLMGREALDRQLAEAEKCWFCGVKKGQEHSPQCRAAKRRAKRP